MEQVYVRPARIEDAEDIFRLNTTCLNLESTPEITKSNVAALLASPANAIFVAVAGDGVVGYLHLGLLEQTFTSLEAEVHCLAVDENSRGGGAGRKLMAAAENWAAEQGAAAVYLTSGFERETGHLFYEAVGYEHTRNCKAFYRPLKKGAPA